jgi:hypothetical protein
MRARTLAQLPVRRSRFWVSAREPAAFVLSQLKRRFYFRLRAFGFGAAKQVRLRRKPDGRQRRRERLLGAKSRHSELTGSAVSSNCLRLPALGFEENGPLVS